MEKLKMHSVNKVDENVAKIAALFPNCITERITEDGKLEKVVDFDMLKQELSSVVVEGTAERYQFTWPDKKNAILVANAPISKTLRLDRGKSIGRDGTLGSVDTENLFIEGDNLDALKLLLETYLGKIKFIYIDPPYNTGSDFIYADDFSQDTGIYKGNSGQYDEDGNRLVQNAESNGRFHTDWLNMMYPRLRVAKDLLSDDGVVFISIDENEVDNLKKICNEIFGADNYAGEIIWKNSSKNDQAYISIQHEYFICYVKSKAYNEGAWVEAKDGVEEIFKAFDGFKKKHGCDWEAIHREALEWYKQFQPSNPIYASKHYSWMDERGVYFPDNIAGPNFGQYVYDVTHPITGKICKAPASGWRFPETTLKEKIAQGLIHFGKDESTVPNKKTYLKDTLFQSIGSVKYQDGRVASKQLTKLMGGNYFTNPKDVSILKWLISAVGVGDNDIVLDFFAGSSSTAQAVLELNAADNLSRKFIMIQIQEDLDETLRTAVGGSKAVVSGAISHLDDLNKPHLLTEISEERIQRAGKKIKEETGAEIDYGFRVFKLDTSNMKDVYYNPAELEISLLTDLTDNIKEDRTPEDLLFQVMLDLGILLSSKIEETEIAGKKVFKVDGNFLVACFDKDVTEETITAIAKMKPIYFVMRDSSMANDSVATNFDQIFATYSPETVRKVL